MNVDELFTRAVSLLPGAVRERLDGDFPLDWSVLEAAGTGAELGEAVRNRHRLPRPIETLVHRLVRDIGIVPADVAAGVERQGAASAWIHWATLEADGESYHLRNERSGDIHTDIRPEAVAGYATLGMDLATSVHETVTRWLEAGEHHQTTPEDERGHLAQCAVRMHAHLHAQPENISGHRTAAALARTLEYAWNTQSVEVRAKLSGIRLSTARGARAPRRSYYSLVTGHRLHACDAGEIRWLRALAERAAAGVGTAPPGQTAREIRTAGVRADEAVASAPAADVGRAGAPESGAEESMAGTLKLGSEPEALVLEAEIAELERVVHHLPGAVRRRMEETYGAGVTEALRRLRTAAEVDALRAEMRSATPGKETPAPRWLEELATTVLQDAGAQTREGMRTASFRLDSGRQSDRGHRVTDIETGAFVHLTPTGLVEQIRLGLAFAHDAWKGLTALRNAGKESEWALTEAQAESAQLAAIEREPLEAARDIGQALHRIRRSYATARGEPKPSALEHAVMAAEALRAVGPTVRTAAGWSGTVQAPSARNPDDVARIAAVAETLHGEIRAIANRLIAGWVAEVQAYGNSRNV